jgi:imidazolonepropionase-like amidohydrolase
VNKILSFSLLLLVVLSPFSPKQREGQPKQLVFTHVTVIDATGSSPKSNMTVVITNDRITEIGATAKIHIPQGAQIVDASNSS